MQKSENPYIIPFSIVVAGILIAGAVMYAGGGGGFVTKTGPVDRGNDTGIVGGDQKVGDIRPVDGDDHILGNPDAPIKLVEYSDLECPFCSRFHVTMKQIMDQYGKDGRVAWVYRHFPLSQIHPTANKAAEGSECAGELGGNTAFWAYIDEMFVRQDQGLNIPMLSSVAVDIGLNKSAFEKCLNSDKYTNKVQQSFDEARAAGGTGTPYTLVVVNGETFAPINGALPFAQVSTIIDQALEK